MSHKETIFFAHATGFQGSMYRQFFKNFERSFDVLFFENFGRNPNYPIVDNWSNQAIEVANFLKGKETPV
ncbi:MAG: alpha/beta hydrolase, partial [Bdellovibrionota bacterium]|nr:alpha/beta hydrolase [Bdellovibrionota bacterium]